MHISIGQGGMVFGNLMHEGCCFYFLEQTGSRAVRVVLSREELVHLHEHAAPFDREAETDAIYDGPKFTARRHAESPDRFGVVLSWVENQRPHTLFFLGEEWDLFLQTLESVCTTGRAT